MIKKIKTTYNLTDDLFVTVNEEIGDLISLHDFGEPCGGVLRYWNSKEKTILELRRIADLLEKTTLL